MQKKTKARIRNGIRKIEEVKLEMENTQIIPELTDNYLEVILDRRLIFGKYISYVTEKKNKKNSSGLREVIT